MASPPAPTRTTLFVTHAAEPADNEFALWLSSKLAIAGYRVWIDRRRLRGGADFWDEIEHVLRNEAVKQIVVFSKNVGKPGVKKELAIGDVMRRKLDDPNFMIPLRIDDIAFGDAPSELIRDQILDGHPNWHDALRDLFETLEEAGVPKNATPDAATLRTIVEAREEGRRFIVDRQEHALSNWFPIKAPPRVRYYRFEGLQEQMNAWLAGCRLPHVHTGRLAGTFADPPSFLDASSFHQTMPTAYDTAFDDFVSGRNLGPYAEKAFGSNDVVNLLRQHFDQLAERRGLLPVDFANGERGWFFPDDLLSANKVAVDLADGRRIRRAMSGKFKRLRWHVCIVAKPRIWPALVYRVHANVVLSVDGKTPLGGEKTHVRRRRLTRSWWNNVWRDRLLAAMHYLANGAPVIAMRAGDEPFEIALQPLIATVPVSYDATDPPLISEEDEEGNIIPSAALDDHLDDTDDEPHDASGEGGAET
jgi:TIR domain